MVNDAFSVFVVVINHSATFVSVEKVASLPLILQIIFSEKTYNLLHLLWKVIWRTRNCFNLCYSCADPKIFMRGGPTKWYFFYHRRGGLTPRKSRNYLFLGKIFKFQRGSGPPVPPSGSAHVTRRLLVIQRCSV